MDIETKALTVQIPKELHKDVKTLSSSKGLKLREFIIELFEAKLKEEGIR